MLNSRGRGLLGRLSHVYHSCRPISVDYLHLWILIHFVLQCFLTAFGRTSCFLCTCEFETGAHSNGRDFSTRFMCVFIYIIAYRPQLTNQGPVVRSLVNANHWLSSIKINRLSWYLTLVSTNQASSNSAQSACFTVKK